MREWHRIPDLEIDESGSRGREGARGGGAPLGVGGRLSLS